MTENLGQGIPTLVYVHGVGGPRKRWFKVLQKRVAKVDPSIVLDPTTLITVDYTKIVKRRGHDDRHSKSVAVPRSEASVGRRDLYKEHKRMLAKEFAKFSGPKPVGRFPDFFLEKAGRIYRARVQRQAKRYLKRRRQVRELLLAEFDKAGSADMIVIAHSLGTVVMADLLPFLGPDRHIRLLITVGSPMGVRGIWKKTRQPLRKGFPYDSVSAWVNIWSTSDYICSSRGIKRLFPQVVDVRIAYRGKKLSRRKGIRHWKYAKSLVTRRHALSGYANHPAMAHALVWAWHQQDGHLPRTTNGSLRPAIVEIT